MASVNNILLVVVDALRPDRVGTYSQSRLTPNIDAIAADGEVFESCYACINATDPSMTTILSGLYPTSHGVLNHGPKVTDAELEHAADVTFLAERLQPTHETFGVDILGRWHADGFDTYHNGRQAQNPLFIHTGVDLFSYMPSMIRKPVSKVFQRFWNATTSDTLPYVPAETVTEALRGMINDADDRWFALAHFWDTHIPYVPMAEHPEKIQRRSYPEDDISLQDATKKITGSEWQRGLIEDLAGDAETVGDMKRKYDAGVARVDEQLGRLVQYLRETNQYEETLILITADHGESLTEHNVFFDHHTLYDPSVKVPLIIKAPGFSGRESTFVQHFDIVPTVLDVLDHNPKTDSFDGDSLQQSDAGRSLNRDAVYFEETFAARRRAIRTCSKKLIMRLEDDGVCRYCNRYHAKDDELYNITSDPGELDNQINTDEDVSELRIMLKRWIEARQSPGRSSKTAETDEEVERRLEDMGYL